MSFYFSNQLFLMVGLILSGLHVIAANLAAENFRDVVYYGRGSNNLLQKVQN